MSKPIPAPQLGRLDFAPGQHPNGLALVLVETAEELQAAVAAWIGEPIESDMEACCCYDCDAPGPDHGFLILCREHLTRSHLVHECTHAALLFASQQVMRSAAVQAMSEAEQCDYYDEAVAQMVEALYRQGDWMLFGVAQIVETVRQLHTPDRTA